MDEIYYPRGRTEHQPSSEDDENLSKTDGDSAVEKKHISKRTSDMSDIMDVMLAFSMKRQQYQQKLAHEGNGEVETQQRQQMLEIEEVEKQEAIKKVNDWLHHGVDDSDEPPSL